MAYTDTGKKVSKKSVNYRPASLGSMSRCETCSMFLRNGACTLVEGRIEPAYICDRYEPKAPR